MFLKFSFISALLPFKMQKILLVLTKVVRKKTYYRHIDNKQMY